MVQNVDRGHHRISLEFFGHVGCLQHRSHRPDDTMIPVLYHPILLGGVERREVSLGAEFVAVVLEACRCEFPTPVSV
jgi:hypothetical protein